MTPQITWVNHASFIFKHEDITLISDPWLEFTAFNNGWSLVSETKFKYESFKDITHIWFSHEHPDHFSPPVLKKIPKEYRKTITVLYQETKDKKVLSFCEKLGFKIKELGSGRTERIASDMELICQPIEDNGDSWLYIKTAECKLLNLNDCIINSFKLASSILERCKKIDVLATQFSYASWAGNPQDKHLRKQAALEKLDRIALQIDILKPSYVIPFASYVYFSHRENFYLNDSINDIRDVHRFIESKNVNSVVMYPDDIWEYSKEHDSQRSISLYEVDWGEKLDACKNCLTQTQSVSIKNILDASVVFREKINLKNSSLLVLFQRVVRGAKCKVYLEDLNVILNLSPIADTVIEVSKNDCDISMSSESLLYCYQNLWGADTLHVNGRFVVISEDGKERFFRCFSVARVSNQGTYLDIVFAIQKVANSFKAKILRKLF